MNPEDTVPTVPGMVTITEFEPDGRAVVRAVPEDSDEARNAGVTAPLTEATAAQLNQADLWRRRQTEATVGDAAEGLGREAGLAWARGAMLATPIVPFIGAAGYGVQRAVTPGDNDSYLDFEAFRAQHPFLSMLPGAAYDIGAAILTGGAAGAGELVGQQVASRLGGGVGARLLAGAGGAAVDGGVAAMQQAVQEAGIQNTPLEAEQVAAQGGAGALLGGGIGLLFAPFMPVPGTRQATSAVADVADTAGEDMLGAVARRGRTADGGQFLAPELPPSNAFTRAAPMVSRIEEDMLRERQMYGAVANEIGPSIRAAEVAADRLENVLTRSDSELESILGDGAARQRYLQNAARAGQAMGGASDAVVAARVGDALQDVERQFALAREAPLGLDAGGQAALRRMSQLVAETGAQIGPGAVSAERAVPLLDNLLTRARAIPNQGNFQGLPLLEGQLRNVLGDESVFGHFGATYRELDDALNVDGNLRSGTTGWRMAQQRIRQRIREGGTGGGQLTLSGKRLRSLMAPSEGGDTSIRADLDEARNAYTRANRLAERLTGRSMAHLDALWQDAGESVAVANYRANAVRSQEFLSNLERRNAGLFAGAGISGVGLGALAGGLIGGPVGAVLGGGVGLAFAALSHPVGTLSMVSHVGSMIRGGNARLAGAVSRLRTVSQTGRLAQRLRRAAPAVPEVLARLGSRKTRVQEYQRVTDHLRTLAGNPEALQHALETTYGPIHSGVSPEMATGLSVLAVRATQYLTAALPAVDQPAVTLFPDAQRLQPSDGEINDFLLKYQVALDPICAVEDAASGTLTAQGAEALRTLYPLLFQEVQVQMVDALQGMRRPSYAVANQLSLLMNTPADVTHTERFVFAMQQNYAQTGMQEQSQRAPRHVLRTNGASATSSQSMEIHLR